MNIKEKLLTISIPTWNRAQMLDELLNSISTEITTRQLQNKIQVLVSNNASTDNTEKVVLKYAEQFDFFTYRKNEINTGAKSNVLKSMECAETPYVMFIGDDDRISIDRLQVAIEDLSSKKDIGVLIDTVLSKYEKPENLKPFATDEFLNYNYYYMGNASIFIAKTAYFKEQLGEKGYDFFNECWPQTQCMILGLENDKSSRPYCRNYNIPLKSRHGEVMIYSSYYLWRTVVYDLLISLIDIKPYIAETNYQAARKNFDISLKQNFLNLMQCGVFVDSFEIRKKTVSHIFNHLSILNRSEKMIFCFIALIFLCPVILTRPLSRLFVFSIRGKKGIQKLDKFITGEKLKIEGQKSKPLAIRKLEFDK